MTLTCRYLGPILDKVRAGECFMCFKAPQQQAQPKQQLQPLDEDVAAEASRLNDGNRNILDILEMRRSFMQNHDAHLLMCQV